MTAADLGAVATVTNLAFGTLRGAPDSQRFPALLFETRLAADPAGCFVTAAPGDPATITGALFSVARGGLGWFGPLAVHPGVQRGGFGRELTAACLESWRRRDVRLMGLETFGDSPFHVRLYAAMGFRPAWTGVSFSRPLGETAMPAGVQAAAMPGAGQTAAMPGAGQAAAMPGAGQTAAMPGAGQTAAMPGAGQTAAMPGAGQAATTPGGVPIPDLSYLYPRLDVSGEAAATLACGAGVVLSTGDGVALCHLKQTFQGPQTGYLPFLAARSRESFDLLMAAAEHLSRQAGHTEVLTRTSGSSWATMDALAARGYRAGDAKIRMKRGENPGYDHTETFYCDNWL